MTISINTTILFLIKNLYAASFVFDLTKTQSKCADFLRTSYIDSDTIITIYQPYKGVYEEEIYQLSRSEISLSTLQFIFLQTMHGEQIKSDHLRRLPNEQNFPSIGHIFIPYNAANGKNKLTFIIPWTETSQAGCFKWPALIKNQNNTSTGLLSFPGGDKNQVFYYIAGVQLCSTAEIVGVLGNISGTANVTGIPSTIYPLNINCDTPGVETSRVFVNGIGWNFCFWLLFCTLVFLGTYAVASDSEVKPDSKHRNNWLTHYPPYSIYHAASEHYTRTSRLTLLTVAWAAVVFFEALLVGLFPWIHLALRLILIPFAAALFSLIFEFIAGWILSRVYKVNKVFVLKMQTAQTMEERLKAQESWECQQYRAYFLFYIVAMFFILGFICGGTVLLNGLWRNVQAWWLFGLAIAMAWLLLVVNPLLAFSGKTSLPIHRLLCYRGYWFDFDTANAIDSYHLQ